MLQSHRYIRMLRQRRLCLGLAFFLLLNGLMIVFYSVDLRTTLAVFQDLEFAHQRRANHSRVHTSMINLKTNNSDSNTYNANPKSNPSSNSYAKAVRQHPESIVIKGEGRATLPKSSASDDKKTLVVRKTTTDKINAYPKTHIPKTDVPTSWLSKPVINLYSYAFLQNASHACRGKQIEVVIACPVSRSNFAQRQAIRDTWGSYARDPANKAVLIFFIGNDALLSSNKHSGAPSLSSSSSSSSNSALRQAKSVDKRIQEESTFYQDIVQSDFIDSYRNLSIKSMSILKWVVQFCPHTDYVIKADDDMYLVVPTIVAKLRSLKERKKDKAFMLGVAIVGAKPVQDKASKWHTPKEMFNKKVYPRYLSGTSYTMTGPAARLLLQASIRLPLFWLEDIFITGLCSRLAGLKIIHDPTFTYGKPKPNGCEFRKYVTGHDYNVAQIRKIHQDLQNKKLECNG